MSESDSRSGPSFKVSLISLGPQKESSMLAPITSDDLMMLSQLKIFSNEEKEALKHKGQANLISSRLIKLCKCTDHNDPNVIDYGNYHIHNEDLTKKTIEKQES